MKCDASPYQALWEYLQGQREEKLLLSFEEICRLSGTTLNHAFLSHKKESEAYGWRVEKISLKNQTVSFCKNHVSEQRKQKEEGRQDEKL